MATDFTATLCGHTNTFQLYEFDSPTHSVFTLQAMKAGARESGNETKCMQCSFFEQLTVEHF